ncbi:hypothetical protein [Paenibacillus albicereus]|nr:hypothetical protein [Paenibacillus albicereus]
MDRLVMVVSALLIGYWAYRAFYNWLHEPKGLKRLVLGRGEILAPDDPHVLFLESHGYEVISGKHRVPLVVDLDGKEMSSRLYVDYVAVRNGDMYAVKLMRERQPLDWTGSGLRDRLLVFHLLLPELEGILLIDTEDNKIRTVKFELNEEPKMKEA